MTPEEKHNARSRLEVSATTVLVKCNRRTVDAHSHRCSTQLTIVKLYSLPSLSHQATSLLVYSAAGRCRYDYRAQGQAEQVAHT